MNKNITSFKSSKILNYLFILLPISFAVGNFAINLNVFLIIILGIFLFKKDIIDHKKKVFFYLVLTFFIHLIISTIINNYNNLTDSDLNKSLVFLRYLLFLLVVNCMVRKKLIDFKLFFIFNLVVISFVSLDVIYQSQTGTNFFGMTTTFYHNPGIFGDELIAGGYIQKFWTFSIFSIPLFFFKNKNYILLYILFFLIGACGIVFAGNRMPIIMFFIFTPLVIFFLKKLKIITVLCFLFSIGITYNHYNSDLWIKMWYNSFFDNVKHITYAFKNEFDKEFRKKSFSQEQLKEKQAKRYVFGSGHINTFLTGIDVWNDKPIIGNGIKSFRKQCRTKDFVKYNRVCNQHPHNYYLEILDNTGLIGFIALGTAAIILIYDKIILFRKVKNNDTNKLIFYAFLMALLIEMFPIKSTGSFFATFNASYIFLIVGLMINLEPKKN
tara:strand:+ start:280 stop:1596 length:1317 start_codon:yes stop_codon:yes gene_type:complete